MCQLARCRKCHHVQPEAAAGVTRCRKPHQRQPLGRGPAGRLAPTLADMSDFSPYEDLDGAPLKGPLAEYAAFYDDYDEEPTEAERAAAVEEFLADAGRFPGVGDSLDRARQAEIDADYPGETPPRSGPTRREPASIEM